MIYPLSMPAENCTVTRHSQRYCFWLLDTSKFSLMLPPQLHQPTEVSSTVSQRVSFGLAEVWSHPSRDIRCYLHLRWHYSCCMMLPRMREMVKIQGICATNRISSNRLNLYGTLKEVVVDIGEIWWKLKVYAYRGLAHCCAIFLCHLGCDRHQ